MTITNTPEALKLKKWRKDFSVDYVRRTGFEQLMGNDHNNVIATKSDLKNNGNDITISIVANDESLGVADNETLVGNESEMKQFRHTVGWWYRRNAIALTDEQQKRSAPDQLKAVRPLLENWCKNMQRKDIIDALHMVSDRKTFVTPQNTKHKSKATDAEINAWMDANEDRILFGKTDSNYVAGDFAASLANITDTDLMSLRLVSKLKTKFKKAGNMRPTGTKEGSEFLWYFCGSDQFNQLTFDAEALKVNVDARKRGENNPLFKDGDLLWKGVIIREIPEINNIDGAGAGTPAIDLAPGFMCGAEALAMAYAMVASPTKRNEDDYGHITGRGIREGLGINKVQRKNDTNSPVDHSVLTCFTSAKDVTEL